MNKTENLSPERAVEILKIFAKSTHECILNDYDRIETKSGYDIVLHFSKGSGDAAQELTAKGGMNMKTAILEKVSEISHHYGLEPQMRQTAEECAELIQALMKYFREDSVEWERATKEHILEETADVWIMIRQLWELMGAETEITEIVEQKVDRQMRRIRR